MSYLQSHGVSIQAMGKALTRFGLSLGIFSVALASMAQAQFNNFIPNRVVGGVKVDAAGVVRDATMADRQEFLKGVREQFRGASADFAKKADLRMISLKGLQQQLLDANAQGKSPSEDVLFLGGLTKIEYVFVYPDQNDIVIAGPAENWKVGDQGVVVGQVTGLPVLCLDDLLTAMRSVETARTESISVSIDPTPAGIQKLEQVQREIPAGSDPRNFDSVLREAFGPQQVRLTGIPTDSHMANVLLAADYQMKRYGMHLVESPVRGLNSYLEMVSQRGNVSRLQSRWWLSTAYGKLEHSEDGLAWHVAHRGMKANTEQDFIDRQGNASRTGKADALAKKWADVFTSKLDELALKDPVFGELQNVMDVCVLAALIESKDLCTVAGCDLSTLRGQKGDVSVAKLGAPQSLPPQSSFLRAASGWVVSMSGGVMVDSWQVADNTQVNPEVLVTYKKGQPTSNAWCW